MTMRCAECLMRAGDCLCEEIPKLSTRHRIVLILHHAELHRPSNTGRLAVRALENAELRVHGSRLHAPAGQGLLDDSSFDSLVLFPSENAITVEELIAQPRPRPLRIIVPDGTWSQANRIARRVPEIRNLPRLMLPAGEPSLYVLRRNQNPGRVCTLEAIAALLGVLEGPSVERALRALLDVMVQRTLKWKRSSDRIRRYEELTKQRSIK